jgi:phospholipid/cholesterol/gamma-HCH transport system substrate-binding protein
MERRKDIVTRLELKVGIAAGVALLLLAIIIFSVGKIRLGHSGYPVYVTFNFVDAINPQADVLIGGGVKIGHVETINIQSERIVVRLIINHNVSIPVDAKFQILSKGLMGDKYINVIPTTETQEMLKPGSQVEGMEPANMDKAFQRLGQVADSVRALFGDPEMKSSVVDALKSFSSLSRRLDRIVSANEGRIDRSIRDFSDSAREVSQFSRDLKGYSTGLQDVLSQQNRENMSTILQNLRATSEKLAQESERISQGQGALGVLVHDEQVGKDLKQLVKEIKENPWKLLWKQ